jgi:hypothetical protein
VTTTTQSPSLLLSKQTQKEKILNEKLDSLANIQLTDENICSKLLLQLLSHLSRIFYSVTGKCPMANVIKPFTGVIFESYSITAVKFLIILAPGACNIKTLIMDL